MGQTDEDRTTLTKTLSFADAAVKVLDMSGAPLHYRDITQRALGQTLIQTDGKTPEASLNAILSVDIKQNSHQSRFIRLSPGVFGLRSWGLEPSATVSSGASPEEETRRVRIPHFPSYSELRLVLPIWNGRHKSQITGLRATIGTLRGTPQEPGDWTNPDEWIAGKLQGEDRDLAEAIWKKTKGKVNPRHVYGHWLLACTYQLLVDNGTGQMLLSKRGQDFVDRLNGEAVALVDEQEGVLKILTIVAEKGTGRRADFIDDWSDYLARYSRYGTDSTIKDTLSRRLHSILERGLLAKTGATYSITDAGLSYLRQTGGSEDTDTSGELQEIFQLVN
ncbi:MAG: winged helix-turn-helix domain-containing protein, partial [Bacteroidota bacterium]